MRFFFEIETDKSFESLSSLVEYYRKYPIKSKVLMGNVCLGVGVSKKTISIDEDWYMPDVHDGTSLLMKTKYDGSFLVESVEKLEPKYRADNTVLTHVYNLRFFKQNKVYHEQIFVEEGANYVLKYHMNNVYFMSLKELVEDFCIKKNLTVSYNVLKNEKNNKSKDSKLNIKTSTASYQLPKIHKDVSNDLTMKL